MGRVADYFKKKREAKARERYTSFTPKAIALGEKSGNPVFLFKEHPVTGMNAVDHFKKQMIDYVPCKGEPLPEPSDVYFSRGLTDKDDYGLCDIHSVAFVALSVGRGIKIAG